MFNPDEINKDNFEAFLSEMLKNNVGRYDYNFLLNVYLNISDEQCDTLIPYIIDRFITENFELCEWQERFRTLELAKEIFAIDMFGKDVDFSKYKLTDSHDNKSKQ